MIGAPQTVVRGARLAVLVDCGPLVVAIAADQVVRLVLAEDAAVELDEADPATPGVVRVDDGRRALFDLGGLLDLPAPRAAFVLVDLEHGGERLPIALGTGRCYAVRTLPRGALLPRSIFTAHAGALSSAFAVAETGLRTGATYGAWLEPERLIDARMRKRALDALGSRGTKR